MAGRIRITTEDLNKGRVLEPGWYNVVVTNVEDSAAKSDGSINTTITMEVLDGPFKGAQLFRLFNEKAPGFAIPFIEAVLGQKVGEGEFELEGAKGKTLKAFVENELYQGQMKNRVNGFQKL